jgi:hypothetical protein
MLQISLSKDKFMVMIFLEDLFPFIPKGLYQERVYRSQLRGSNGFSPFSLLVKASCQPGFD